MSRFRYAAVAEDGTIYPGILEAETLEEARDLLEGRGYRVERLEWVRRGKVTPLPPAPEDEPADAAPIRREPVLPPPRPAEADSALGTAYARGDGGEPEPEREARATRPSPLHALLRTLARVDLARVGVALGVVVFASLAWLEMVKPPPPTPRDEYQAVSLRVRGRVLLEGSGAPPLEQLRLTFHFPDVPLDVDGTKETLRLGKDGSFEWQQTYFSRFEPRFVSVTASAKGYRGTVPAQALEGTTRERSLELECVVPDVRVTPDSAAATTRG